MWQKKYEWNNWPRIGRNNDVGKAEESTLKKKDQKSYLVDRNCGIYDTCPYKKKYW